MGILNDHEEQEVIDGKALHHHDTDDPGLYDLIGVYTTCVEANDQRNHGPHRWRSIFNERLQQLSPTRNSIDQLARELMHHTVPVIYNSTQQFGVEGVFLSTCMQHAYNCGANNFTLDIGSWGDYAVLVGYNLQGTEENPLSFQVLGRLSDASITSLKHCTVHIEGDVHHEDICRFVLNSTVHLHGTIPIPHFSDCRESSFYIHKEQELRQFHYDGMADCTFYLPTQEYAELWQSFFNGFDKMIECEKGNKALRLPEVYR